MKVLLTGGGTGGHTFPLVSVARKIRELAKERGIETIEFLYVGPAFDSKSEEVFKHEGIKTKYILTGKLRRYYSALTFIDLIKIPIGVLQALWILFIFMPDAVFSKGGYGSFPAMLVSWLYRIPVRVIHESDVVPGIANKITSRFATRIGVAFEEAALKFPLKKTALVGLPTRGNLCNQSIEKAQEFFNIKSQKLVLLIMGGSQGAQTINDAVLGILPELLTKYEVIHITGSSNYDKVKLNAEPLLSEGSRRHYHIYPFLTEEIKFAYTIADMIISRSGASSIFEMSKCEKPSVIIPLKSSAQNHQRENAYVYAKSGGTIVIEEDNLTPHILLERVKYVLDNEDVRKKMGTNAAAFATKNSSDLMAREILTLLRVM